MSLEFPKPEDMRPHVDVRTCARCRKKFLPGDRIAVAHIFLNSAMDSSNLVPGANISDEYELVHIHCGDPKLSKGVTN